MISTELIKKVIVLDLCGDIMKREKEMRIEELSEFLNSPSAEVHKINGYYICNFGKKQARFEEEPTTDLLKKYIEMPVDVTRQIATVEDLQQEIVQNSESTNPFRLMKNCRIKTRVVEQPDIDKYGNKYKQQPHVRHEVDNHDHPACKRCGKHDYLDCNTHFTCKFCATVRTKIHSGVAYREMRDRETDMNGRSMELNGLYSSSFNTKTKVVLPKKTKEWEKLQLNNDRLSGSPQDTQIFAAKEAMYDVCGPLLLGESVVTKAHVLYCKHRKKEGVLRNEGAVIAACLFYALPKYVKYKKIKRTLTPWNDTKKRKLKLMNIKKPIVMKKRRYGITARIQSRKKK